MMRATCLVEASPSPFPSSSRNPPLKAYADRAHLPHAYLDWGVLDDDFCMLCAMVNGPVASWEDRSGVWLVCSMGVNRHILAIHSQALPVSVPCATQTWEEVFE